MITHELIAGGVVHPVAEVTSWYDGAPLHPDPIPIAQGTVTETASGDSLGALEITVPAMREWIPTHPMHPLAAYGQELMVRRGFQLPDGGTVGWETLGTFRILPAEVDGGWIQLRAESVDTRLNGARWVVSTRTEGTFAEQAAQICAGVVPVIVMAPDRSSVSRSWEQQDSRRSSLFELCDSWGTVPRMVDGQLTIVPLRTGSEPDVTVSGGRGGSLVDIAPVVDAELVTNVVVASSVPEDETAPLTAMAVIRTGPRAWDGPYGQHVRFFASPLLTTLEQCQLAAETTLARLQAVGPDIEATMITNPSVRLDSVLRIVDVDDDTDVTIRVTEATHALTAGVEPGSYRGVLLSGRIRGRTW